MRKNERLGGILLCASMLTGCAASSAQASASAAVLTFKEVYESLNGTYNTSGKENRTISIPEDAPFVDTQPEEVLTKAEEKETFYVVYSDALCPWCRSVMEEACKSAVQNHIDTVYAVDIWNEQGEEIFRDQYEVKEGELVKIQEGTDAYQKTLELFGNVLSDYTLKDANGTKYNVGEKRIFAPNFIYVKEGKAVSLTEGISNLQQDAREELTDAIRQDEDTIFNKFFTTK